MRDISSRRDFIKTAAVGLGVVGTHPGLLAHSGHSTENSEPHSDISVWITAGEKRFTSESPIQWQKTGGNTTVEVLQLDPQNKYQEVLGFGGAFTDSTCYMFNQMDAATRENLLHELFHTSELGLNVCRTCIGSSDCSVYPYSYDGGVEDPQLARFSIAHDHEYILPILRRARQVSPELFLFSSPWSPPGWMKWNGSMLGGSMSRKYLAHYSQYILKFLQAYAAEGVPIDAITCQNEVDTDQRGQMPACLWAQEAEVEFVGNHLGPLLQSTKLPTKIWILDHNYNLWGRAICELEDPDLRKYVGGVAWHCYAGTANMIDKVHQEFPDVPMYFTEGGGVVTDPDYKEDWTKWAAVFGAALRNWCRSITVWNLALDETGGPRIGPYPCAPMLTIHSQTKEIGRTGLYWALAHYARKIKRGAVRIDSETQAKDLEHAAFINPDGQTVLVLVNSGARRTIQLRLGRHSSSLSLPENSVATLAWS
jgi:glucosylceramidase